MIDMSAPDTSLSVSDFDLDIIQEVLTSQKEKFPKPPPPPRELEQMNLGSNHNSAMLVSRGTGPQTALSYSELHPTNMALGSSQRRVVGQVTRTGNNFLEEFLEKPKLVITEQPKERGMRFRYQCEGRSAGSIQGASSTEVTKTLPAIEIQGCTPQIKKAKITVSLVTKDIPHRPHPHSLVGKDCADGVCVVRLNLRSNQRHSFTNLGIQCVRRKELDAALENRRRQKIDPFNTGHSKSIEDIDMNVVRLCFQCELEREDGEKVQLGPVLSNSIYDKKATTTSELKINRLNVVRGPCTGKTEIYLLCDKVQKDDIEIIFSNGNWEAKAEFAQTDVHRQVAIVFKSPPYQEQDISEEVEVNVALRRLSDHMDSEPVKFTYLPHNPDPYEVNRKRKTRAEINFSEFNGCYNLPGSHQFESLPPVECTPSMPSTFQDGDPPQSAKGLEEIHYNSTIFSSQEDFSQDISTISPEDILSLTQLLLSSHSGNMEQVQEFGFENTSSFSGFVQAPADQDPNSNFVHPSMDLNLNVSGDAQEFYNDVQFCQHNSQLANGFLDSLPSDHAGPASQGLHPCDNDGHVQPQVKMENHVDH